MRLFIALQLADNVNQALVRVMHDMKKKGITGNYVPLKNLHMTLAFIGETDQAEAVKSVLQTIPGENYRLSLAGYGAYGDVFWVGVKGNQRLKKYVSDLKNELIRQGIPCDRKKLEPHITVIRKMKGNKPADLVIPPAEMAVNKISLMKSEQKEGKTVYKELFSVSV